MPRKAKIGIDVPHVTRDSDTTFKVKRSKVKVRGGGIVWWPHYRPHSLFEELFDFRLIWDSTVFASFMNCLEYNNTGAAYWKLLSRRRRAVPTAILVL